MITITEEAAGKVREAQERQAFGDDHFLRVGIRGGGCSGLLYALAFDNEFDPATDTKFTSEGITIVTRKKFAEFLDGTEIYFTVTPNTVGFMLNNPNFPLGQGCSGCHG